MIIHSHIPQRHAALLAVLPPLENVVMQQGLVEVYTFFFGHYHHR